VTVFFDYFTKYLSQLPLKYCFVAPVLIFNCVNTPTVTEISSIFSPLDGASLAAVVSSSTIILTLYED
jgi:hypothetical protein